MSVYTYFDYIYFKIITDKSNGHHNHLILNQIPDFHITSPFKLSDDIFESLTNLFVDKMIKMDKITCSNCGSVITSQCTEQKESKNGSKV